MDYDSTIQYNIDFTYIEYIYILGCRDDLCITSHKYPTYLCHIPLALLTWLHGVHVLRRHHALRSHHARGQAHHPRLCVSHETIGHRHADHHARVLAHHSSALADDGSHHGSGWHGPSHPREGLEVPLRLRRELHLRRSHEHRGGCGSRSAKVHNERGSIDIYTCSICSTRQKRKQTQRASETEGSNRYPR